MEQALGALEFLWPGYEIAYSAADGFSARRRDDLEGPAVVPERAAFAHDPAAMNEALFEDARVAAPRGARM